MERTHGDTQKLDNLYNKRNRKDKKKGEILIESDFQRMQFKSEWRGGDKK